MPKSIKPKFAPKTDFKDLFFFAWSLEGAKWLDEGDICLSAHDEACETIAQSLESLAESLPRFGGGTRKYQFNPPQKATILYRIPEKPEPLAPHKSDPGFDEIEHESRVKFSWWKTLTIKASGDIKFSQAGSGPDIDIHDREIIATLGQPQLRELIEKFRQAARSRTHGRTLLASDGPARVRLLFAVDWLGVE